MTVIDWSKAPEGATHYDTGRGRAESFMKREGDQWFFWPPSSSEPSWHKDGRDDRFDRSHYIVRPIAAEWTGEGLPPVGAVCEAEIYDGQGMLVWREARVIHHHPRHEGSAAIAHGSEELLAWASSFRPLRTPEQIAAEERERSIGALMEWVANYLGRTHLVRAPFKPFWTAAYDAGLRAPVQP